MVQTNVTARLLQCATVLCVSRSLIFSARVGRAVPSQRHICHIIVNLLVNGAQWHSVFPIRTGIHSAFSSYPVSALRNKRQDWRYDICPAYFSRRNQDE